MDGKNSFETSEIHFSQHQESPEKCAIHIFQEIPFLKHRRLLALCIFLHSLFEYVCYLEYLFLPERWSENLEPDGKFDGSSVLGKGVPDWKRESGKARETACCGEDIRKVFFQRVILF